MNGAEVRISSRFTEGEGELFVGVQHFGLERLRIIRADDRVRDIVTVDPCNVTVVPTGTVSVTGPKLKLSTLTSVVEAFCCACAAELFPPVPKIPMPSANAAARPAMNTLLLMLFLLCAG
jgi:hypothetical protein